MSLVELLKKNECIHIDSMELSSGINSDTYYDIKKAAGIPKLFSFIIKELKSIIPKNSTIVSVSTGGISFGAVLAYEYETSFAYIRESKKKYGTKNCIEGHIDYSKPVYIIDDVCTTGRSIINAKNKLSSNHNDYNLVCIIDRGFSNIKIKSICKVND